MNLRGVETLFGLMKFSTEPYGLEVGSQGFDDLLEARTSWSWVIGGPSDLLSGVFSKEHYCQVYFLYIVQRLRTVWGRQASHAKVVSC